MEEGKKGWIVLLLIILFIFIPLIEGVVLAIKIEPNITTLNKGVIIETDPEDIGRDICIYYNHDKYISVIPGEGKVEFFPEKIGLYKVGICKETNYSYFIVVENLNNLKEQIKTNKSLIDKKSYFLGERIKINNLCRGLFSERENTKGYLEIKNKEFKYIYNINPDSPSEVYFSPEIPGNYSVFLSCLNRSFNSNFKVENIEHKESSQKNETSMNILKPTNITIIEKNKTKARTQNSIESIGLVELNKRDLNKELFTITKNQFKQVYVPKRNSFIKKVIVSNIQADNISNISQNINQLITIKEIKGDLPYDNHNKILYGKSVRIFSIESNITAEITIKAKGEELWKCKEVWNNSCIGEWEKVMDLEPGKEYSLKISPGDPLYTETGLATFNAEKPFYEIGEDIYAWIVVLDKYGYKKDANLTGIIFYPDGSNETIDEGFIKKDTGVYILNLTKKINNRSILGVHNISIFADGENVNTMIKGRIIVSNDFSFDVIRNESIVIDPWKDYIKVDIYINPTQSTYKEYRVIENLDPELEIININTSIGKVTTNNNTIIVDNATGRIHISYKALAPQKTPDISYTGPLEIYSNSKKIYDENRKWIIALDPSASTFLSTSGQFTGTYSDSGGSHTNTHTDDTSYWYFGSNNNNYDITAWAELTYDISSLGIDSSQIINLTFQLVYCHDGSNNAPAGCDGDSAEGSAQGTQLVQIYNYSSSSWVTIGSLRTDDNGYEVSGSWTLSNDISEFISSSNNVRVRYEMDYSNWWFQDSWLVLDYAPLIVNYYIRPHYTNWGIENGTSDIVDGANLTRNDNPKAHAKWNVNPTTARIQHTGIGEATNYTIPTPYTGNWTNYTMDLNNANEYSHLGRINVSIWAEYDNFWNQTTLKYFYLWSYAKISEISLTPNSIYQNENENCSVYWWDSNWQYRKRINITNNAGGTLPARYSVNITIDTTGQKFRDDGADVRIVYYNESSKKYIELDRIAWGGFNKINTTIWFRTIKEIPQNGFDDNYYIYYGNPTATNPPQNYSNVFILYDDFENGNINSWQNYSNGVIQFTTDGTGNGVLLKTSYNDPNGGYVVLPETLNGVEVMLDFYRNNENGGDQTRYGIENSGFSGYGPRVMDVNPSGNLAIEERSGGSSLGNLVYKSTNYFSLNTWFTLVFRYYNQNMWLYVYNTSNNQLLDSISTSDSSTTSFDRFVVHGGYEFYTDNVRIRKYVNPEPTVTIEPETNYSEYSNENCTVAACRVIDEYASPTLYIENYLVNFYENGTLIGTALTGEDGWARIRFGESELGTYNISCNISGDSSAYLYQGTPSEEETTLNVVTYGQDVTPPTISNINEAPDPVEKGAFINISATVTDENNVSSVWAIINGEKYYFSIGENDIWYLWYDTSNDGIGEISYTIYANDSYNNIESSSSSYYINPPGAIEVDVETDKNDYYPGEEVEISTTTTLSSSPTISNVTTDIIKGNTSYPWWNTSWKKRKPIYLTNPQSYSRTNEIILVNITDLNGSITNCNQLRIVSTKGIEVPFTVESGDNSNWCTIKFIGNISGGATNQILYFAYYNNTNAPTPSYNANFTRTLFFDDFETNNFGTNWVQDSQNDWFRNSQRSRSYGSWSAEVDGYTSNGYIQLANPLDLRGAGKVTLTYSWFIETNWDSGESICLDIYDGGWHTSITCVQGNVDEGNWIDKTIDLSSYNMIDNFNIRYRATVSSSVEDGNVDLVNITIFYSDIQSSIGEEERFIERNNGTTNNQGVWIWNWNSSNQETGLYSAVSIAEKNGWESGRNYTTFNILSNAPIIWWTNATPEYQLKGNLVNLTAKITSVNTIDKVIVNITSPNGQSEEHYMNYGEDDIYYYQFSGTDEYGPYIFIVKANDTNGETTTSNSDKFYIVGKRGIMAIKTNYDAYQGNMNVLLSGYTEWSSGDKEPGTVNLKQESGVIYSDGFENGLGNWVLDNDTVGTITDDISAIDSDSLPHSGNKAMYMYSDSADGSNEQMTSTLTLNLSGRTNVILKYYWAQEDLESDDGGYLDIYDGSWDNGVYSIKGDNNDHSTSPGDYQYITLNLSQYYNLINGFQIRFRGVMEGTYNIDLFIVDDLIITADPYNEENTTLYQYSFGGSNYDDVNDIAIVIGIDSYSKAGSNNLNNNPPDLKVGIFNGSTYINYTCSLYNTTIYDEFPKNCTIRVRDKDNYNITNAWKVSSNRKIFIQGINLDGADYINYSYVEARVNTPSRLENYGPTTLSGRLLMQVYTNNSGSWQLVQTVYNQTQTIDPFETLDIASLWNSNPWNTGTNPTGYYMAYAALINSTNDVIIDQYGYPINDSYIFTITTAPLVRLIEPEDNSWKNESYQVLYYNVSAVNNLENCSLYINGVLNQTKDGSSITNPGTNNFTTTFNDGTYNWSIKCIDNIGQEGNSEEWTINIDITPPIVNLENPSNNSQWNTSSLVEFEYNVSDANNVTSCSLWINGSVVLTDTTIEKGTTQSFYYNLDNGDYEWWVTCRDIANNTGSSVHYFLEVNYTPKVWKERWYETLAGGNSYSSTQTVDLLNYPDAPDGNEDYVEMNVPTNNVKTFVIGYSPYLGGNGVYIPANQNVTFVGVFKGSTNVGYITWKLYRNNESGDYLICMSGDDYTGGTRITPANTKAQFSNKCNVGSNALRLGQNDRFKLIVNIASKDQAGTYTHYWDHSSLNSYFELSNMYTLSFIKVQLTEPNESKTINNSEEINVSCLYNCSPGTCLNVKIYLQYNSTTDTWTNIGSSGGLILKSGSNNPIVIGDITNSSGYANFTIIGNTAGHYNIRCYGEATYSTDTSDSININVTSAEAPNVTLNSPENGSWHNVNDITFYYTPNSDSGISNCSIILDGEINQTDTTISNGIQNSFTIGDISEGQHRWSINCTGDNGLTGNSEEWYFYVDLTKPEIILQAPVNDSSINKNTITFNFTFIDNLAPNGTCNLTINGVVNRTNIFVINNTLKSETIYGFSQGIHYWNVTCLDLASNINTSETWRFNVTDSAPIVTLLSPQNDTWSNKSNQVLYYNVSENNNIMNCSLYINGALNQTKDGSSITNPGTNNFTTTFNDGTYNWSIKCIDDSSLEGESEEWIIHIDTTAPNVNLKSPNNGSQLTNSDVDLIYNVTDNMANMTNCTTILDGNIIDNRMVNNGSEITISVTNLTDGIHYWNVTCKDYSNNTYTTETWWFNISEPPTVSLISPPANGWVNGEAVFVYLPDDNTGIDHCDLIIDETINQTDTSIIEGVNNNFTVINMSDGAHTWTVNCTDDAGLSYQPSSRFVFVDKTAPNITLLNPQNGITLNTTTIFMNFTVSDTQDSQLECNITLDGEVNESNILVSSGEVVNRTWILDDGTHEWYVTCWDDAQNINQTEIWNFTIKTPPTISLISPDDNIWTNETDVSFNYIPQHNQGISNCSLIMNGVINQTDTNIQNGETNTFTVNNISEKEYEWWINCTSITNVEAESEHRTLYVDRTAPTIVPNYPTEGEVVNNNYVNFNFTVIDNIDQELVCNLTLNGAVEFSNIIAQNGSPTNITDLLHDGEYNYSIICWDNSSNIGSSSTINFTIEAPPNVTLVSPENEYYSSNTTITFEYTPYDPFSILYCELYIDNTFKQNDTIIENNQINRFTENNIDEGKHNWTIRCVDADNNPTKPSAWNFTLDRTQPHITLLYPSNGANIVTTETDLNFTVTDALSSNFTCNVTLDNNVIFNGTVYNNTITNISSGTIEEAIHYWNVTCVDLAGNTNISETWNFSTISPPNITLVSPLNNSWSNQNQQVLFYNVSDTTGIENCSLYINGVLNQTKDGSSITNPGTNNFTTTFNDGTYNWSIKCYDNSSAKALGESEEWVINIDLTKPNVDILTSNNSWFNTTTPQISFRATDNMADIMNYSLIVDGNVDQSGQVSNNTEENITTNSLLEGIHYIKVNVTDKAKNENSSETITIYIDVTPPNIQLNSPQNNEKIPDTSITFNYTVIDNLSPNSTCELVLDGSIIDSSIVLNGSSQTVNYETDYGTHYWNVSCTDIAGNTNTSETWNFTIVMPDLTINAENITFNESQFIEGKNITVFANVYNIGENNASNFTVEFRRGGVTGELLGSRNISSLSINENKTLNISFIQTLGINNIFILVDTPINTNGSVKEKNESNNVANKSFIVESWHYVYGNTSATLYMYDSTYNYSYSWSLENGTGSKIMVVDSDSIVDWLSLQALGRNVSGGIENETKNDFEELDTALSNTNYPDNINTTYTYNGAPIEIMNITILMNTIENVPVVNSTNNSNFKTGILWDTSDDTGDGHYSGSEDIVFITIVNESKQGKWGVYDFEERIPSRLRYYKGTDNTVTFYTAIK